MVRPDYRVNLISEPWEELVEQPLSNSVLAFGLPMDENIFSQISKGSSLKFGYDSEFEEAGQTFKFSKKVYLKGIKVYLLRIGGVSLDVVGIRLMDASGETVLQTSPTTFSGSAINGPPSLPSKLTFTFSYILEANVTYSFALFRTGNLSSSLYYTLDTSTANPYLDGALRKGSRQFDIMASCDAVTGWNTSFDAITPTLNTSNQQEGTGCLNLGDSDGTGWTGYYKGISQRAAEGKEAYAECYFINAAIRAKFTKVRLSLSTPPHSGDEHILDYDDPVNELVVGWNKIGGPLSAFTKIGDGDLANIQRIYLLGILTGDVAITLGDWQMDYFRLEHIGFADVLGSDARFELVYDLEKSHAGQGFNLVTFGITLFEVRAWLGKVGTPTDAVKIELRDSSNNVLVQHADTKSSAGEVVWQFTYPLEAGQEYYFACFRTGDMDPDHFWTLDYNSANAYPFGNGIYILDGDKVDVTGDLKFKMTNVVVFPATELGDKTFEVTTNTGKSKDTGEPQKGTCDLKIYNTHGDLSPSNTQSPYYNRFKVNQKMEVIADYDGQSYFLFKGIVSRINPDLLFNSRIVHVVLEDLFSRLGRAEVSIGSQPNKKAHELVEALLSAHGLEADDYLIDSDDDALKSVTWDNVKVLDKLKTIVEAGQHHHFIDGQGRYVFKNNQWLDDNTPKYLLTPDNIDGQVFMDYDLRSIINRVIVEAATSVKEEDINSINEYGIYENTIDNELMPTADNVYATVIAEYVIGLNSQPGNIIRFTLKDRFPEILDLKFGDIVSFIDNEFTGINDKFIIINISHFILKGKIHSAIYLAMKWVLPPAVTAFFTMEPFIGDAWLDLTTSTIEAAQSFKVTSDGKIHIIGLNLKHDLDTAKEVRIRVYAADGSDFPTGGALASSNYLLIAPGEGSGFYEFTFPENQRPTLLTANTYVMVLNVPKTKIKIEGVTEILSLPQNEYVDVSNGATKISQSFVMPETGELDTLEVDVFYDLPSSEIIHAYVYNESGDLPTGAILATSNSVNVNGTGFQTLQFDFSVPATLPGSNKYCIVLDTPESSLTGEEMELFIEPSGYGIKAIDLCTDGDLFEVRQTFRMPFKGKIEQANLGINNCSDAMVLKIYKHGTGDLKATSDSATDGQFAFAAGERPEFSDNEELRLRLEIVATCKDIGASSVEFKGKTVNNYDGGQFWHRCTGGFLVGHSNWDLWAKLLFGDRTVNNWRIKGSKFNAYGLGKAGKYVNSAWQLTGDPLKDYGMVLHYTTGASYYYENRWEVWGDAADPYANGKASYRITSWYTAHPWDFYFILKVLEV